MIELLKLPRLRNAQLQVAANGTIEHCKQFSELKEKLEEVNRFFEPFKEGMRKASVIGTERKQKDKVRDDYTSALMNCTIAEKLIPTDDEQVIAALENLTAVLDKYSFSVTRLPLDEETAELDNMLAEIDRLDLSALEGRDILRWPVLIKAANEDFKVVSGDFIEDNVEAKEILAASKIAPDLSHALDKVYVKLFSLINVHEKEEHIKSYLQIQEIIKSFS
jgi:hypothetical protein